MFTRELELIVLPDHYSFRIEKGAEYHDFLCQDFS